MLYNKGKLMEKTGESILYYLIRRVMPMGKRINEDFLSSYMKLDNVCCDKFHVVSGGVTAYINRLNNARFAPDREEVLPRLVRYRNIRNRMAHEAGLIKRSNELTKTDVAWVKKFSSAVEKQRDPISVYLRKARRYAKKRKLKKYFTVGAFIALAAIVIALVIALG